MFVLRKSADITIEWPVVVELPVSGGGVKKFEFTGVFERLSETDLEALSIEVAALQAEGQQPGVNADAIAFFSVVLKNWKDVRDEAGEPVPYLADALETVLTGKDGMVVAIALWRAHNQMRAGAKAKN